MSPIVRRARAGHALPLLLSAAGTLSWACAHDAFGPGTFGILSVVGGNGQSAPLNAPLAEPLSVFASDGGSPLGGREIQWRVIAAPGPGARLTATSSVTGADGLASVSLTLGSEPGAYTVEARTEGGGAEFTAIAEVATGGVQAETGSGQVGRTAATLPEPLVARLTSGGLPAPGVDLTFAVTEGEGASVSPPNAVTDADGRAEATLTLGPSNGPVRVSVDDGTGTSSFIAYACGGDPGAGLLSLAVGADTTLAGEQLACLELAAAPSGAAWEAVLVPADPTLTFHDLTLSVAGAPSAATAARLSGVGSVGRGPNRAGSGLRYAWDARLRALEAEMRPQIRERAARIGPAVADVPAVGDTVSYAFSCVDEGTFPGTPDQITGVVTALGERGVVVEDTAIAARFTAGEAADIASNFDDVIFATDTTYFGEPGDIDANGDRVVLLFSAGVNAMSNANPGGYDDGIVAGFFCPTDLGFSGGNGAEMFYLVAPDPTGDYTDAADEGLTKEDVLVFVNGTVAHEFQHLVNAQTGGGAAASVWLNEALSHLAEEVVGHAATGLVAGADLTLADFDGVPDGIDLFNAYHVQNWFNLRAYLEAPSDTAALVVASDPLGPATFRFRGAAWSFLRYLLDRFAEPADEAAATRALVAATGSDARDAVAATFGDTFAALVSDWSATLMLDDRPTVPVRSELTLPSWRLREILSELGARSSAFPAGPFPLPLAALEAGGADRVEARLFSYTGRYLRLGSAAPTATTGLRVAAPDGTDVPAATGARLTIVRVQ